MMKMRYDDVHENETLEVKSLVKDDETGDESEIAGEAKWRVAQQAS